MEAMMYEYLLRRVYNCGRNYDKGADADIYRPMERAHYDLTVKSMYKTQDEREYEYRRRFATVRSNVRKAITDGIQKITYNASEEDLKRLKEMSSKLTIDFYDKDQLDQIIRQANEIFQQHGLEMR